MIGFQVLADFSGIDQRCTVADASGETRGDPVTFGKPVNEFPCDFDKRLTAGKGDDTLALGHFARAWGTQDDC